VPNHPSSEFAIRTFRPADAPACRKLYADGLIGGSLMPNDTGLDMDDIQGVYMQTPGSCFWVAHLPAGPIVGMIGVQHHESDSAEIRRLRVSREYRRRGIGSALTEQALRFCQENQYLKVTLDTYMERETAIALFAKYHYKLQRDREIGDRRWLYFYADLYSREPRPKKQ